MLASYHLFFIAASIILLLISMYIMFFMEEKRWSLMTSLILLGLNTVICWVGVLGFFGVEVIAINSANEFVVYTYPDMYGLNVLPFGILFMSIIVAFVGWGKHVRQLALYRNKATVESPVKTNSYWD